MDQIGKDALSKLLENYEAQLKNLLEQQRLLGNQTPSYVLTDIEALETRIGVVRKQLQAAGETASRTLINTEGGAYIRGNVNTGGGDFVGGDKIIGSKITTGNITGGTGIAIGSSARSVVNQPVMVEDELNQIFAPVMTVLQSLSAERQAGVVGTVDALKAEVAKGGQADDNRLCDLLTILVERAPETKSALVSLFAPLSVGPMTKRILRVL